MVLIVDSYSNNSAAAIELPKCNDPEILKAAIAAIRKSGRLEESIFGMLIHYDYSIDTVVTESETENHRGWICSGVGHPRLASDTETQQTVSGLKRASLLAQDWSPPEQELEYSVQLTDDSKEFIVRVRNR